MTMQNITSRKNLIIILISVVCCFALLNILRPGAAHANIVLNPAPPANSIPANWKTFLETCDSRPFSPALVAWVSPSTNAASYTATVPYGTKSINLNFHYAGAVCDPGNQVSSYQLHISAASSPNAGTSVNSLVGKTPAPLIFNPYNQAGKYDRDNNEMPFTYSKPTGFTADATYTITGTYQGINTRVSAPIYDCTRDPNITPNPVNPGSGTNFKACPPTNFSFTLNVSIGPDTAPTVLVSNPTCSSTGFYINSSDKDAATSKASYSVHWIVYTFTGGVWVDAQHDDTGNVFGKDSNTILISTATVPNWTIPNPALPHYMRVTTNGSGVSHPVADNSDPGPPGGTWGPCGGNNFSFLPTVNPTTDDPLNENPSEAIFESGIDNVAGVQVGSGTTGQINLQRTFTVITNNGTTTTTIPSASVVITPTPFNPANSGPLLIMGTVDRTFVKTHLNFAANGLSIKAGDKICAKETISPATGTADPVTHLVTVAGPAKSTPTVCIPIVDIPYAKWYGSDIVAGGQFGDTAPCTNDAGIYTFNDSRAGRIPAGSGVQFAAIAMGQIRKFTSALGTGSSSAGLSFANTTGLSPPDFLGGFFGGDNCIHNYMDDAASAAVSNTAATTLDLSTLATNTYSYTPPTGNKLTISGTIGTGKNIYLYVSGDVYINNNITYNTTWTSENDIPYLQIVTNGNIFIAPTVTNLNGVYIASSSAAGSGTIYTCAPGGVVADPLASAAIYLTGGACNLNKLTVNGTFIANKIKLLRTINSMRDSNSVADSTSPETNSNNKAAENFTFDTSMYVANTCKAQACGAAPPDAMITGLPPIL